MKETNEQIVERIRQGADMKEAMGQLYRQNRGLIKMAAYSIADTYTDTKSRRIDLQKELEQEAYFGLLKAVHSWEPEREISFITFAMYLIKHTMYAYCESISTVRVPFSKRGQARRYRDTVRRWQVITGRQPTQKEICQLMEMEPGQLEELRGLSGILFMQSLDRPIDEQDPDGPALSDTVPAAGDPYENVLDRIQLEELAAVLWPMVDGLPGDQPQIIRDIFQNQKSLKEAGEAAGIPYSKAATEKSKALNALKNGKNGRRLEAFHNSQCYSYGLKGSLQIWKKTNTSSTEKAAIKLLLREERRKAHEAVPADPANLHKAD